MSNCPYSAGYFVISQFHIAFFVERYRCVIHIDSTNEVKGEQFLWDMFKTPYRAYCQAHANSSIKMAFRKKWKPMTKTSILKFMGKHLVNDKALLLLIRCDEKYVHLFAAYFQTCIYVTWQSTGNTGSAWTTRTAMVRGTGLWTARRCRSTSTPRTGTTGSQTASMCAESLWPDTWALMDTGTSGKLWLVGRSDQLSV